MNKKDKYGGFSSGSHGGTEIFHHSSSSVVSIVKTYKQEVTQGNVETVVDREWYDYGQIKDLYKALVKAHNGNLNWLLK